MAKIAGNLQEVILDGVAVHMRQYPELYKSTTPGPEGQVGPKGEQGVSVHHIKGTNTTDLEGDFGSYGETDTYTLYGDADETINLGHFSVVNGIEGRDSYEYAAAAGYAGTEWQFYEEISQLRTFRDQAETAAGNALGYRNEASTFKDQAQLAAIDSANSAIDAALSADEAEISAASINTLFTPANIKSYYESNANTNAYTDAEQIKLAGIEENATGDMTGAEIKALYEAQTGKVLNSVTSVDFGDGSGPGTVVWNGAEHTLDVTLNATSTLQVGQELVVPVRNATGNTITNGTVVMATGTVGASGRIAVDKHDGTKKNAIRVLGLATANIPAGEDGLVTSYGKVRKVNTTGSTVGESWAEGDVLYIKPNGNGRLTKIKPAANELCMPVAMVLYRSTTLGLLEVRITGIDEHKLAMAGDITVTPQGNLSSTTVQSALTELQADMDSMLVDKEW